jgi:hypothetical protein
MWKIEKKTDAARLEAVALALEKEARDMKVRAKRIRESVESQEARERRRQIPKKMREFLDQGIDLEQAAGLLAMSLDLPEGAILGTWEDAQSRNKTTQRWHRDREIMRLAIKLTNAQIASHPNVKALNNRKALHPQTVSRIIQKRLTASRL